MASNVSESLFHCTGCDKELNLESKTLPCRHNFCRSCLDKSFEGQTNGNGQCPECHEPYILDQLILSPFLVKSFTFRALRLPTDLYLEDRNATSQCHDCQKPSCIHCSRIHKRLFPKDNTRDLGEIESLELNKYMLTDMCKVHKREQCNVCHFDKCYGNYSAHSPECQPSQPLSVREEALKQKSRVATLAKEMDDFEMTLKQQIEKTKNQIEEFNSNYNSKCMQVWLDLEEMIDNAKQRTMELCKDMQQITDREVNKLRHLSEENENILKQLEIWRINLQHFLNKGDSDVVCGLNSLKSEMSSQLQKMVKPEEKCLLSVTFTNEWLQFLEQLKTQPIGLVSLGVERSSPISNIIIDKQWNLNRSSMNIYSIHICKEDEHIFICDNNNKAIHEYTEGGEYVCELVLSDGNCSFEPYDICSISPDRLAVVCGLDRKIIIVGRIKNPPYLRIEVLLHTEMEYSSICQINGTIIVCDKRLQIDSFTKEGLKIKTIKTRSSLGVLPLIGSTNSSGNLWLTRLSSSELFCFNQYGEKLQSIKLEKDILDFSINELDCLYFCDLEGIFSISSKEYLYKFESKSEYCPSISALKNKIVVHLQIAGKSVIKIFKIVSK